MKKTLGKCVLSTFLLWMVALVGFTNAQNDPRANCLGHSFPECPKAKNCTDTKCSIPPEAQIQGNLEYKLSDIGIPVGENAFGILLIRSQDQSCPSTAESHEGQSMPTVNCRLPNDVTEYSNARYLEYIGPVKNAICFKRKPCLPASCLPVGLDPSPQTLTRTFVENEITLTKSVRYLVYKYVCEMSGPTVLGEIESEGYRECDTTSVCPTPGSGSGGSGSGSSGGGTTP